MDPIEEIKQKLDVVTFIQPYVPLKQAGRNFKGLCPFHGEKTPSFMVSQERQGWHCFGCFPPGEKVKTPFGYHNIEEIDTNHWVVSGKGNIRKVSDVFAHRYKGDLVRVRIRKLGGEVKLTADHTVFAIRGAPYTQKKYKDFSKRYRKYLKIKDQDNNQYQKLIRKYFPIREIPAGDLQLGDLLLYPIRRVEQDLDTLDLSSQISNATNYGPVPREIPSKIPIDDNLLKLLGYYIAEGSNHRAYIRFSLGNHEEKFAKEIVQLGKKLFGLQGVIYRRPDLTKTGIEVTFCHAKLANIFENLCGKGAANKHVPFLLQDLPSKKQKILLDAIFKGDGTSFIANRSKNQHKSIITVSRILAEQLVDILVRLDLFPTLHVLKPKIDKHAVNHREAYKVLWSEEIAQKYGLVYNENDGSAYWLLPVTKLGREYYEGPVYNFTVDQDHSYIATNFVVANCGKGGDVIAFYQQIEHLDFYEALQLLAERTGVQLQYQEPEHVKQKNRLVEINMLAARFYHYLLTKHTVGEQALSYVTAERKLLPKTIEDFQIGYAPSGWDKLANFLKKHKVSEQEAYKAGLIGRNSHGVYDLFRERVVFPLHNHRGDTIGFAGRILKPNEKMAKYINSPETPIYVKGNMLYGIYQNAQHIRDAGSAILVEGELDVLSSLQAGVKNVVAMKGTALTENQISLLRRYTQTLLLALDQDNAGQAATRRSIELAQEVGFSMRIASLPYGKDVDDLAKQSPRAWQQAVANAQPYYDWLIDNVLSQVDLSDPFAKKRAAEVALQYFKAIDNDIIREHYLKKIAKRLDTSFESLIRTQRKLAFKNSQRLKQPARQQPADKEPHDTVIMRYLLSLLLQSEKPFFYLDNVMPYINLAQLSPAAEREIYARLVATQDSKSAANKTTKYLLQLLPKELLQTAEVLYMKELDSELLLDTTRLETELRKTAQELHKLFLKRELSLLTRKIAKTAPSDLDTLRQLSGEFEKLKAELKAVL